MIGIKLIYVFFIVVFILGLSACTFSNTQEQNSISAVQQSNKDIGRYKNLDDSFEDINGCAVVFDAQGNQYYFHNEDMVYTEVSPYSTFKVIATLIGLQNKIIQDEQSTMNYNGCEYPLDVWNADLSLEQAFKSSCIWYFRQIIDAAGSNEVQKELEEISYGNCDVSEWYGNDTNPMLDLNGFWINSSLKISPFEQVTVLAKIFENRSIYSNKNIRVLKNIMLVQDNDTSKIYGKTGSSGDNKAWFIGFKEQDEKRDYFAVYLNDSDKDEINGQKAKEIALKMIV